ncbi:MAG: hypothetical protein HQL21_09755 [Candidatus Omnitrophica bacterium]|nr:hypothetical protein [Candidatus Omnitrophota bacterium]
MNFFRVILVLGLLVFSLLTAGPSWAVEDAFPSGKKIVSRHFTITLAPGVDEGSLVTRLNIGPQHKILAGESLKGVTYSAKSLGDLLDALFGWASGVLDMQLYSYRGDIKVTSTPQQLKDVYYKLYGRESRSDKGFYIFEGNTLYVTADAFTREIVGHEVAHAIISNFFVVQPPEKVAEVLAGYIEYQLRKISSAP